MTIPDSLTGLLGEIKKPQLTDKDGRPLTVTYANRWNSSAYLPLHDIPLQLQRIFIVSEDKRFYHHQGVDWLARFHALAQNLHSLNVVRGASTISEQVVRMIHPRKRTLWSRWVEGFDAGYLEKKHSKKAILEFYLNQVPFAANRRGVAQAAHYYFNRSLNTLNPREMIALAVLVRAPSYYDLYGNPGIIDQSIIRLARKLMDLHIISDDQFNQIVSQKFDLEPPGLNIKANHFAAFMYNQRDTSHASSPFKIRTTLSGPLQVHITDLMNERLGSLGKKKVTNAACLVADHSTGDILAWISLGSGNMETSGSFINGVLVPRQPGSSMKPFLYAMALDDGWTAAREILDTPLTNSIGRGLHTYHNYSRTHYGWVSVRDALANSLNIPAVKTIRFVGYGPYLSLLHMLGFDHLDRHPEFYGDGLALGCGEVTLFHMVQAYGALANRGRSIVLHGSEVQTDLPSGSRIFSEEAASIIGNILSDSQARSLEFGHGGVLNFPVQTAVKTGTSSDYKDAWALGYNDRFVAGVWMGNFNGDPMEGVTGSSGPAMVLRSIFSELNKLIDTRPLYISPRLVQKRVTLNMGFGDDDVITRNEWFVKGTEPVQTIRSEKSPSLNMSFIKPVNGLEIAMDPRIPDHLEAFEFVIHGIDKNEIVDWYLDDMPLVKTSGGRYLWTLQKGDHVVKARIHKNNKKTYYSEDVYFTVK